jgi:hypothetical protein
MKLFAAGALFLRVIFRRFGNGTETDLRRDAS